MSDIEIFSEGGDLNIIPDTKISIDCSIFYGQTKIGDELNIFNFEQGSSRDFHLRVEEISKNIPPDIFNSKHIVVNKDINVSTKNTLITAIFNNDGKTLVNNALYLEDKYSSSKYLIKNNLSSKKNFNIFNTNRFTRFGHNMEIDNYDDTSLLINQDFIVENNIVTKKNVNILNDLRTNYIEYNSVDITNSITVTNNFNSHANLNINVLNVLKKLTAENVIVDDSIAIRNNSLYLPHISIHNNIDGSLRYNNEKHIVEAYIKDDWRTLNTIKNNENTTNITHHPFYKPHIGANIDFIQNNNVILSINNNNDSNNIENKAIYINNRDVNMDNIYIKEDLVVKNIYNFNDNVKIVGETYLGDNLLTLDDNLVTISSNKNIENPLNGSIRYNNKNDLCEAYINKWGPLQRISNNDNTMNIDLFPKVIDQDYNSIIFNVNNSYVFNITRDLCIFDIDKVKIRQNVNLQKNLNIYGNLASTTLNINNHNLYKNGDYIVNDTIVNGVPNVIAEEKLIIVSPIDIKVSKYVFYTQSVITTGDLSCNIFNTFVENNEFINNYSIFINKYKVYQTFTMTNIVLNLNLTLEEDVIFTIKINNTHTQEITVMANKNYGSEDVNIEIVAPQDLYITISSNVSIDNLYGKITLYGEYKSMTGNLINNGSHVYSEQPNIFELEDRSIIGNTTVRNNLNLTSMYNLNIPHFLVHKNVGIGTSSTDADFHVKNMDNTLFIHKNNKVGIGTDSPTALLTVHSDVDTNSINEGSILLDKSMNNTGKLTVSGNLVALNNLNVNTIFTEDKINVGSHLIIKNNIDFHNNVNNDLYTINIEKDIKITDLTKYPDLILTKNNEASNIALYNNKLNLKIDQTKFVKIIKYPTNNAKNQISLENTVNDLYFSHNKEPLLNIANNTISTNNLITNLNSSDIFSISSNFNINKNSINIKSNHFIVNNVNLLEKFNDIRRCYFSPYNINCNNTITGNNIFNITYNRPQLFGNLNNYKTHTSKYIEYIGFQFCLGNINTNIHENWNKNSFIYYKDINQINFNHNVISYNNTLSIGKINKNEYFQGTSLYDFNNSTNTYNLNIDNDKTQLIFNQTSGAAIFSEYSLDKYMSLRMFPIYNTREQYLYYSNPILFNLK